MQLELRLLAERNLDDFAREMQEAFQLVVEEGFENDGLPVLPRQDIDAALVRRDACALEAVVGDERVGGAILFLDEEGREHECAFLYVKKDAHGRGVGTSLWKAIEGRYPDASAWRLCTPYFEIRNIYFYLKKCGFHIVDLFEDDCESQQGFQESSLMFSFVKRLDGRWA